jgi:hypothetical protein
MRYIARFIGDERGFVFDGPVARPGWVKATVGATDKVVDVNLDLAYVIERLSDEPIVTDPRIDQVYLEADGSYSVTLKDGVA